ncbi:MAG TPA: F0F1 ATP synthase subunit A [Bryobacteraceae bacterium]|nr:F0F1 ATP synthase subunit A [Bryobacteraceae bacterium]HPT28434.1 F0F1 ATP synthase subunit A [Bryobacteraceae bacterium]
MHHELWFTALLNQYFAAPAEWILSLGGYHSEHGKPWSNGHAMLVLAAIIVMLAAAFLRTRLSADRPGNFQLLIENVYTFLDDQAREIIGHGYKRYVPFFATTFMFILFCNLMGVVPGHESPTMYYTIPAGFAIATFLNYNIHGFREMGVVKYLGHFAGPMWWLAWFMFPLEIISHCIRPVSLTIRLFANMFAGEEVTLGFMGIVPYVVPVVFLGLHVFVSFIQAFIFTVLSAAYVGGAVAHEEH